jgi:type IX secretion system PorP/SprF family membrane protein
MHEKNKEAMKPLIKYIFMILGFCIAKNSSAQDFHFSQYDANTLYMNPALTGMYQLKGGDYKIYADYRSQWKSLQVKPFATAYLSYDQPIKEKGKNWGLGGYFINQRAGGGMFNTTSLMVSGAYDVMNNADGKHYLTTGLQIGLLYRTFNPNNFTYDVQYDPNTGNFDNNIPNEENFTRTNMVRFDANLGIYYKYVEKGKKVHPFAGFSIQHLTKPNESFTSTKSRMPMRFNLNAGCDVQVNDKLQLTPKFLYMNQARSSEINLGIMASYKFKDPYDVLLGVDYRHKDAVIFHIGLKQKEHVFRFSYDINTSALRAYSGGRGAWEFSLIFTGQKQKSKRGIF